MTTARPRTARGLVGNSIALLAMTHITSLLGYVFWMVCARGVSASVIGMTSTVIGAMTLIALLAAAGFMPLLTRVLPGAGSEERSGLCSTAFVVAIIVSGLAGVVGVLLLPNRLQTAVGTGWLFALLPAGAVGTALLLVINAALLGIRRAELSLAGTVVGSVSRLVTVAVILSVGVGAAGADASAAHVILLVWVTSLVLAFGLSVGLLVRATPGFRFRPGRIWLSRLRRVVAWDHVATLAVRSPFYLIPILAAALFPPDQVGYLAMAGMISTAFYAVAAAVSNALLADCADRPDRLRAQARRALRLIGVLLVPPVVIACLMASKILGFFGADYAHYGALLVLGLLATLPDALINVVVAMLRVQRRLAAVAVVTLSGAAISIGVSWLLMPHMGIMGAGWAAVASPTIVATALTAMGFYRWLASVRTGGSADRLRARVADEPAMGLS
jgi:O-antigen/teichoic acid export membrane protein